MEEFSIDTLMLLHDIPSSWTKKHWELFFFGFRALWLDKLFTGHGQYP